MAFKDRSGDILIGRSRAENIHLMGIFQAGVFPQQLRFFFSWLSSVLSLLWLSTVAFSWWLCVLMCVRVSPWQVVNELPGMREGACRY